MTVIPGAGDGELFGDLIDELVARGYAYLGDTADSRAARFINAGIKKICAAELWPFLLDGASGQAPLEIPDLRAIRVVRTPAGVLPYSYRTDGFNALETGSARSWFFANSVTVATWPPDEETELSAEYWRQPPTYTDRAELVCIPEAYSEVVLDAAGLIAAKEARDWDNVAGLRGELAAGLDDMREGLLDAQFQANEVLPAWGE